MGVGRGGLHAVVWSGFLLLNRASFDTEREYSAREERERASIRFLSSVRTMNRLNARTGAQGLPEADPGQRFVHGAVAARNLRPRAEIRINPISSNENKYRSGR